MSVNPTGAARLWSASRDLEHQLRRVQPDHVEACEHELRSNETGAAADLDDGRGVQLVSEPQVEVGLCTGG